MSRGSLGPFGGSLALDLLCVTQRSEVGSRAGADLIGKDHPSDENPPSLGTALLQSTHAFPSFVEEVQSPKPSASCPYGCREQAFR